MSNGRAHFGAIVLATALSGGGCSDDSSKSDEVAGGGSGGVAAGAGGSNAGSANGGTGDPGATGGAGDPGGGTAGGGGEPGGSAGATSGTAGSGAGSDAGGSGGGEEDCNDLANTAELVTSVIIEDDPPMPPMAEGGTLVDGVYEITAVEVYDITGSTPIESRRRTVELRYGGTIWDWVAEEDGVVSRAEAFYEAVDTELLVTTLCSTGPALSPRYDYTASENRILTSSTDNLGRVTVNTFTRR